MGLSGQTSTYDPAKHVVSFLKTPIPNGYGKDSFIKVTRNSDSFGITVGVAGQVVRHKLNDKSGEVELTLLSASQANDILTAMRMADELTGTNVGPFYMAETNGTTVVRAAEAWIKKAPDIVRGKEAGETVWTFTLASMEPVAGGLT